MTGERRRKLEAAIGILFPNLTQAQREARAREQLEGVKALADAIAESAEPAAEGMRKFAEALAKVAEGGPRQRAMRNRIRENIRRQGGHRRELVVTIATPNGSECRRVVQYNGGWRWALPPDRQLCRCGGEYRERDEHGWPKARFCEVCGDMAEPSISGQVGPPDDQRHRTRTPA